MNLKEIMSIAGKPGLYRNIAQSKAGIIVESLVDGKRFQVFSTDKISALEEISIYTSDADIPLRVVFRKIQETYSDKPAPDAKSPDKDLIAFFNEVIPDYDEERFYISHMRKVVSWYNILLLNGITDFSDPEDEKSEESGEELDAAPDQETKE